MWTHDHTRVKKKQPMFLVSHIFLLKLMSCMKTYSTISSTCGQIVWQLSKTNAYLPLQLWNLILIHDHSVQGPDRQ